MIKSILVSLPGFEMRWRCGGPFDAHLECLHIRPGSAEFAFGFPGSDVFGVFASDLVERVREPESLLPVAPIIVGHPKSVAPAVPRNLPHIRWHA
jgi:hypothetical protein